MKMVTMVSLVLGSIQSVSFATDAPAPLASDAGVSSSVRAEIKESIPGATPKSTKSIYYPEPGKINISAVQFCGDGDVATFAGAHPKWMHQEASSMPIVLGYWVVPEGDSPLPKPDNYFALGSGIVPVGGSYISTFNAANLDPSDTSKKSEMYKAAMQSIQSIASTPSYVMGTDAGAGDKFKVYLGAMMCKTVKDQGKYDVMPALASNSLAKEVYSSVETAAASAAGKTSWSGLKDDMRASVSVKPNGAYAASAGSGPVDLTGEIADLAERVHGFALPSVDPLLTPEEQLSQFQGAFASASFNEKLRRLGDALDSSDKCSGVANGVSSKAKYAWEPYPLQLTCKALNGGIRGNLTNLAKTFLNPPKIWSSAEFNDRKIPVLKLLLAGAQMQNVQAYLQQKADASESGFQLPKQRCFDASPYIDYTMQSIVIQLPTVGTAEYTPAHPEGDFAIGGSAPYYADDKHTIFGMTGADPETFSLGLTRGTITTAPSYMPGTMRLNMKVRGIGCNTNVYCQNEFGAHASYSHL